MMYPGTRRAHTSRWPLVLALVAAAAVYYAGRSAAGTGEAATPATQDLNRVESRIDRLEQRFYTIESSIRGLEQQVRVASAAPRAGAQRDPEVGLLRSEVESLRQRLAEVECGLSRVDERTLTPEAREARRKSAAGTADPCRLGTDAPLRLSTRP
jgi:hypothetical protein